MRYKAIRAAIVTSLLAFPVLANAGVNPKNGNFYITYADIEQMSGNHKLDLERTYNSLATGIGWFGYGWGSQYETRLVVLPDGSAVVKERGNGSTTYYRNKRENAVSVGVERIVEIAIERDKLSPAAADELVAKLRGDEELRVNKVMQYGIVSELPKGAALGDESCGEASLLRVRNGYRRTDCNRFGDSERATDTFDLQGRLVRHELMDGYAVNIRYTDARNAEIQDSRGRTLALTWTPEGRVASAKASGTELIYSYDAGQNLVKAASSSGLDYRYTYDDRHNLTRITYIDNTHMDIVYSKKTGMAESVTDRRGGQQTFSYERDPRDTRHHWTKHTRISPDGQKASKVYEFRD